MRKGTSLENFIIKSQSGAICSNNKYFYIKGGHYYFRNRVKNITITVEDAVKKLDSNEYSVDFIAQRSDEQWSDEQKVNLLDSIFCGIVLPNMVIVQCEGKDEVIDGKQRLTTLKNYINNLLYQRILSINMDMK